ASRTAGLHQAALLHLSTEGGQDGPEGHSWTTREMSIDDLKEGLVSQGIADAEVQQMTSRTTKKPLPLFLVKTKMPEKLLEIQRLAMLTVSFERKKKSTEPSQCYRCQRYGHTQRNCRLAERCVKCGEDHSSSLPAPPTGQRNAKCCLCGEGHPPTTRNVVRPRGKLLLPPKQSPPQIGPLTLKKRRNLCPLLPQQPPLLLELLRRSNTAMTDC
ncbi:unnamed protein product, partial [Acanthoscelides obtectus]